MTAKERYTVAFFFPSFEIGGAERNAINLLGYFNKKQRLTSLILARKEGGFVNEIPKETSVFDLDAKGYLKILFKLIKHLKQQQPDILISAFPHFNIICLLAKKISGAKTKIIATEHTPFFLLPLTARNFWNKLVAIFFLPLLIKIFYPSASAIICVSNGVAKDLTAIKRLDNIKVVYNPIVGPEMMQLADEPIGRSGIFDDNVAVIVAVGRLAKAKDYPTLLKAVKLILEKRAVRLIILGDGPEEGKLKKMASELGLSKAVIFLGFQNNPYKYIKRSSVFVLSSVQEGFGNTIVEAMACATPVVATDCHSGPAEIIEDKISGLLVPPQNEKAIAKAILMILEDSFLAKNLSDSGRERAQYFSIENSASQYENIISGLIDSKS